MPCSKEISCSNIREIFNYLELSSLLENIFCLNRNCAILGNHALIIVTKKTVFSLSCTRTKFTSAVLKLHLIIPWILFVPHHLNTKIYIFSPPIVIFSMSAYDFIRSLVFSNSLHAGYLPNIYNYSGKELNRWEGD